MEKVLRSRKTLQRLLIAIALVGLFQFNLGCSSSYLKYDEQDKLSQNDEFDKFVKIDKPADAPLVSNKEPVKKVELVPSLSTKATPSPLESEVKVAKKPEAVSEVKKENKIPKKKKIAKPSKSKAMKEPEATSQRRQPDIESDVGFAGSSRRPIKDPFRVGEKVTHRVSYFKMKAGELSLEVMPFVYVNGVKSYNFRTSIKSSSVFSSFYAVDDYSETLMDFENLIPTAFSLHVKESGQLREAKAYFDPIKNTATYWEKKVTKKSGKEEKKLEWDILPYTQNVFSAAYYMRIFSYTPGENYAFRVADDKENILFKGKVLRKEKLSTDIGEFDTIVIKPEFELNGVFKPVGDIYIWISDDDRKYILRIESAIRIGTLVSEVTSIEPGEEPQH